MASVDVYQFNQFRLNFKPSAESLGLSGTIVSFGNYNHGPCEDFFLLILKPVPFVCGLVHYLLYYTWIGRDIDIDIHIHLVSCTPYRIR